MRRRGGYPTQGGRKVPIRDDFQPALMLFGGGPRPVWRTPRIASLSGRHPPFGGHLPRNRTCAVHIRLFRTAGCEPRRRPVYDLKYPPNKESCSPFFGRTGLGSQSASNFPFSVSSPNVAKLALLSARSTTGSWLRFQIDLRPS